MSDLPAQFFHSEDSFCISVLWKAHPKNSTKEGKPQRETCQTSGTAKENAEHNVLPASPKEVTFLMLRNG